jgi:hypothetical protein
VEEYPVDGSPDDVLVGKETLMDPLPRDPPHHPTGFQCMVMIALILLSLSGLLIAAELLIAGLGIYY